MGARAKPFTASGILQTPDQADDVWGVAYTGFTSVTVYDGQDATGKVIIAGGAGPATIVLNYQATTEAGIYVAVAGTGKGSLLV